GRCAPGPRWGHALGGSAAGPAYPLWSGPFERGPEPCNLGERSCALPRARWCCARGWPVRPRRRPPGGGPPRPAPGGRPPGGGPAAQSDRLHALVEAARQEGALDLVWGDGIIGGNQGVRRLAEGYNRAYGLNVDVRFTIGLSFPEMAAKVAQEYQGGRRAST